MNLMKTLQKLYNLNNKRHQLLIIMACYCISLLLIRAKVTQSVFYFFLIWNLFLAFVPYGIIILLKEHIKILENRFLRVIFHGLWLLFLPNSFYILTDFVHLSKGNPELFWLDLIVLTAFSLTGFLLGLHALQEAEYQFKITYSQRYTPFLIFMICLLSGFGVYLGRFLRFNSWNIFSNPMIVFEKIHDSILQKEVLGFSVLLGSLIYLSFHLKKIMSLK